MLYFGPFDLSDLFMINRQAQPLLGDHTIRAGDVVVSPVIPFMVAFKLLSANLALILALLRWSASATKRAAPVAAAAAAPKRQKAAASAINTGGELDAFKSTISKALQAAIKKTEHNERKKPFTTIDVKLPAGTALMPTVVAEWPEALLPQLFGTVQLKKLSLSDRPGRCLVFCQACLRRCIP